MTRKQSGCKSRKSGLNTNKDGSVRKVNGKVYIDFMYLGERVRESSGLPWNDANARQVREELDQITVSIKKREFRFARVFPHSRKAADFAEKERRLFGREIPPENVNVGEFILTWYNLLRDSERVQPRTLLGYRSYIDIYLKPFFGSMTFDDLTKGEIDKFVSWSKNSASEAKRSAILQSTEFWFR